MNFYVDKISKYRECIMGVAILWIVWYHSFLRMELSIVLEQ